MAEDPAKSGRLPDGRFAPGNRVNPAGRKQGSRNKASIAVLDLLEGEGKRLTRRCIAMAMEGDSTAMRLCMERLAPPKKDKPIRFNLVENDGALDLVGSVTELARSVSVGELTPSEAAEASKTMETIVRARQLEELDARLRAIESAIVNNGVKP